MSGDKKPTPPTAGGGADPAAPVIPKCPCPTKVVFKEHGDTYGWDDYTNAAVPWKSVEKGGSDTVAAEIEPAANATAAAFVSADVAKATVAPAQATAAKQVVTLTGVETGETEVKSTCDGSDLGRLNVATYVKKIKTVAVRLVHEKNHTSTDIPDADIKARLKKVYKQAVVEFTLTRLPAMTVNYDKSGDGQLDAGSWMSDEMRIVRDACKDDSYDFNVFLVSKPSNGIFGIMMFRQKYGFVFAGETVTPLMTFSHELGHGLGLEHRLGDTDNVMNQGEGDNMWRLRKDQWDQINPG